MKTVKRKAEVGERIISHSELTGVVKEVDERSAYFWTENGHGPASHGYCEVIIEDEPKKPSAEEEAKRVSDALALCMEETNKTSDQAAESISGVIPPHSAHYHQTGIDPLEVMRQTFPAEQYEGFLRGNALKYIMRYPLKGTPVEDLEKAKYYVDKLLGLPERTKVTIKDESGNVVEEFYEEGVE